MRTVWLGLLFLLTGAVAAGLVYVIVHKEPVNHAGQTPGYSYSALPSINPGSVVPKSSDAPSSSARSGAKAKSVSKVRTVFLGDDYTAGVGASSKATPWTTLVSKQLNLDSVVIGENGAGYAKQSSRGRSYLTLVPQVVDANPSLVVVSGGRNDTSDAQSTLRSNARMLFAKLHKDLPSATLVAIAPWWGDSPHPPELGPVDNAVKAGVQAAGGDYLKSADPLFGHHNFMSDDADPNDAGYHAIAKAVATALAPHVPS